MLKFQEKMLKYITNFKNGEKSMANEKHVDDKKKCRINVIYVNNLGNAIDFNDTENVDIVVEGEAIAANFQKNFETLNNFNIMNYIEDIDNFHNFEQNYEKYRKANCKQSRK